MLFKILLTHNPSTKIYKLLFLIIISAIAFFNHISTSPLGIDDAFYAQKAKEMVINRDWFYTYPTHGGRLNFDNKPPVLFWMLGLAGSIFGFTDGAMRFFPAVFGLASVIALFLLATYLTQSESFGFLSSFVLLFTQQFIYYSRSATPETFYTLLWILSLLCFKKALDEKRNLYYIPGGTLVGIAIITRQIPALMIYVVFLIYAFSVGKFRELITNRLFYIAVAITLIISAPWHIIMINLHKKTFVESYFGVLTRYGFQYSSDWYEYLKKILENYWPWLPFFIVGSYYSIKKISSDISQGGQSIFFNKKEIIFIFSIIIPYYLLIQLSSFRAPQYLVPLYPFMALLSSEGIFILDKNPKRPITKILIGIGTALALLWLLFPILPRTLDSKEFIHFIKMKDTLKYIEKPIYTPDAPDLWHFRNGGLFYSDKDILLSISTPTVINWLSQPSKPPYYFIIKKRYAPSYFGDRFNEKTCYTLAETDESILFSNKNGYKIFTQKP